MIFRKLYVTLCISRNIRNTKMTKEHFSFVYICVGFVSGLLIIIFFRDKRTAISFRQHTDYIINAFTTGNVSNIAVNNNINTVLEKHEVSSFYSRLRLHVELTHQIRSYPDSATMENSRTQKRRR